MGSRWTLLLVGLVLVSSQLQIPLEVGETETDERLERDLASFFDIIAMINRSLRLSCLITYPGDIELRPSLEQRLMENFSVPVYAVGSHRGPLNRPYPRGNSMVVTLLSGLDEPNLAALNDPQLAHGSRIFGFLYAHNDSRPLSQDEIFKFFSWCWERRFVRSMLFFQGQIDFETWSYFYFSNIRLIRLRTTSTIIGNVRSQGYRFTVQAAIDLPTIFWYNSSSSEQTDVIGGNIRLSGPIGLLMVEFVRHINATMDIVPIPKRDNSNYEIPEVGSDRRVDMVANLVANDNYRFSPMVMDTKMCLLVPHRKLAPFHRYFDRSVNPSIHIFIEIMSVAVFGVKYLAHRRRSVMDTLFSTLRYSMGIPLPGGQLNRLPLADKILEVYCFFFVGTMIGASISLLTTSLTTGIYEPPITDVDSMRASGLRIMTFDPTVLEAFRDNQLPRALVDLVDLVEFGTLERNLIAMNDSVVYVVRTSNWKAFKLYQQRMKYKKFELAGPKLCSNTRPLRLPISPHSPLRFIFEDYFRRVTESGLQQKWLHMGFQKFLALKNITSLPMDESFQWKPLSLDFFSFFLKIYLVGISLSISVFVVELLWKRYGH